MTTRNSEPDPRFERFCEAYLLMARKARYQPAVGVHGEVKEHSNGSQLVTIRASDADPVLEWDQPEAEASAYAAEFVKADDEGRFYIGCSDFETNRAFVFVIEAARLLCAGSLYDRQTVKLLKMAIKEIKEPGR